MERKKNPATLGQYAKWINFPVRHATKRGVANDQLIYTLSDECGGIGGGNGWMYIPSLDIRGGTNAYFNKNRKWSDVKSMFYLQVRF